MLWMTFSLIYSIANRQCQLWAGIFVVNPGLKLKTMHAHRRFLYARECCRRETSGQCWAVLGHRRQWWPKIDRHRCGVTSGGVCKSRQIWHTASCCAVIQLAVVWRLEVACANPVRSDTQRPVVQLSSWLRRLFIHVLSLSVCPRK